MSAYVILDAEVTDPGAYEEYKKQSTEALAAYGGKFLVRGGPHEVLEGDWSPSRIVLFEFPDMASARSLFNSDEYAPLMALRRSCSSGHIVLVDGE